jgi:hypothetical protein
METPDSMIGCAAVADVEGTGGVTYSTAINVAACSGQAENQNFWEIHKAWYFMHLSSSKRTQGKHQVILSTQNCSVHANIETSGSTP